MQAQAIQNAVTIKRHEVLPNGVKVLIVPFSGDMKDMKHMPRAVALDGVRYALTGVNTDKGEIFYRDDRKTCFGTFRR